MFYPWCFFSFFLFATLSPRSLDRSPWNFTTYQNLAVFYKLTSKIRGALPQKNLGAKNLQNCSQFWTTSDFDLEYIRNEVTYPKSERRTNYGNSSCVWQKKSGELWSTNGLELHVSLDPLKCTFWGYYTSALRGCCALKFLHALDIDQGYLAHTPTGTGVPPKNFNRAH